MRFDEVLRSFSALFEREDIRYAPIGGLALRAWGHVRATQNAGFVVQQTSQPRVLAFAESEGFETIPISDGYSNHVRGDDRVDVVQFAMRSQRSFGG